MNFYIFPLIGAMLILGINVGISKTVVYFLPVTLFAFLRFLIAATALTPLYRARDAYQLPRHIWQKLFFLSFMGNFAFTLCMVYGVKHTSVTSAGLILSTLPAVVALFSWWFLNEPPNVRTFGAIVLAVTGLAIVNFNASLSQHIHQANSLLGNVLVLGSVICEAIFVLLTRHLSYTLRPSPSAFMPILLGSSLACRLGYMH